LDNITKSGTDSGYDQQAKEDLKKLLDYIRSVPELIKYFRTREGNATAKVTTYEHMWTLFAPGSLVLAKPFLKQNQVFKVEEPPIPYVSTKLPPKLFVSAYCWDYNGKKWVKVFYNLAIENFRGTKEINQLECYPINYYDGGPGGIQETDLRETLIKRGEKYISLTKLRPGSEQMYIHRGPAVSEQRNALRSEDEDEDQDLLEENQNEDRRINKRKIIDVNGKFLIDPTAFLQYGGGDHVLGDLDPLRCDEDTAEDDIRKAGRDEEFSLLCPPRLLGYSTHEKTWAQFRVEGTTKPPDGDRTMFTDQLQLDEKYKTMIQALVESHASKSKKMGEQQNEVRDVVKGKGEGLVILLHGPPGVGKTLTAETIAEATNRPLFIVSIAEIGLNASKAERNLEQLFQLAGRWEAILLV
jgi:hypothetical protein